ncbi:MAG: hypothetical protein GY757_20720 [bacterium]|nr:hypothetical protein [bacterium]
MDEIDFVEDQRFHIMIPKTFPGVDAEILDPRNTWKDKDAFDKRADSLAAEFVAKFEKVYGDKNIDPEIVNCCPGK